MNIFFLTCDFPWPVTNGAKIRNKSLIIGLSKRHNITLCSFYSTDEELVGKEQAERFCEKVVMVKRKHSYSYLDLLKGLILPTPFSILNYYSNEMYKVIGDIMESRAFDLIQIEGSVLAPYGLTVSRTIKVLDLHNLEFEKMLRYGKFEKNILKKIYALITARKLKRYEMDIFGKYDFCLTCSEREKSIIENYKIRTKTICVPNGALVPDYSEVKDLNNNHDEIRHLLFVGPLNADKNVDCVLFFSREILPLIRNIRPDVKFIVIGKDAPSSVKELSKDSNIRIMGYVEKIEPYFGENVISVVPLRYGGGTRLKICEAMGLRTPVVSTSIGCEGQEFIDGKHILIRDNPKSFAEGVLKLMDDHTLRKHIINKAYSFTKERYNWEKIAADLCELYCSLERSQ